MPLFKLARSIYLKMLAVSPLLIRLKLERLARWVCFYRDQKNIKKVPAFIVEELEWLAHIEPSLYPTSLYISKLKPISVADDSKLGQLYATAYAACSTEKFDFIVLLPWLISGGSDLVALHITHTLSEQLNQKVLVLTTFNRDSPWQNKLSQQVVFFELGRLLAGVKQEDQEIILARLLLQLNIPNMHIMNSDLGWTTLKKYGKALSQNLHIYASLYADEINQKGLPWGYAQSYLPSTYLYLNKIACDNQTRINSWIASMGIPSDKFQVIYSPCNIEKQTYQGTKNKTLLWASRLTESKRIDVLLAIAKKMPDFTFIVYGVHDPLIKGLIKQLSHCQNVYLKGTYNGFSTLFEKENYLCFLYTSHSDGIPNVVLEAIAHGLAVIAPNVGGISEIINPDTGYLIKDFQDSAAYVQTIQKLYEFPQEGAEKWHNAYEYLQARHSKKHFTAALKSFYQLSD